MPDNTDLSLFQQRLAEKRAREAAESSTQQASASSFADDLVPEEQYERSDDDKELDRVISNVGIIEAYNRWCGKMKPTQRGNQTESIMISCPKPDHADKNPSAWINSDKNTWFCGTCQEGGDVYDIAAYNFGFPVPGYKTGVSFHELRRKMAGSLGYTFIQPPGVQFPIPVPPSSDAPVDNPDPVDPDGPAIVPSAPLPPPTEPLPPEAVVTHLPFEDPAWDDENIEFPTLDWRTVVQPDTFLDIYMRQTHIDDVPEEYHLWNGLLALGFAVGRDVTLYDRVPVLANLYICLLGNTGDGKSRSFSHVRKLLYYALPHKWDDTGSKGTHVISSPASAEVLIHNFSKPIIDPTNPKLVVGYAPVRGLIEFNELSALTARTNRQGNALKPTLMEFYDGSPSISTTSMTTGKKQADLAFGSAFTTSQPRSLKELIKRSDADSGFLNRWIFASGKPKDRIAIGGVQIDISPAVKPLQDIQGWAGFGKTITWDDDAAALFTKFFHEQLHPKQQEDRSGLLVRMDLTFKKLILLLTVNSKLDSVPREIVNQVIGMYNYLIMAYAIPAAQVGNTTQIEIQDEVLRHIKRLSEGDGKGVSYRDLSVRLKNKKYQPDQVHRMLKILCDMGEIEALSTTGRGRPTVRYKYCG